MEAVQIIKGYELRERIGSGGFGVVHRAYQSTLGREVAIKIILPHYANHPDFIRRFESEAQLIARLEHPHIVPLYDYWREPEGAYLVMRWLRGGSLREALQNGPFKLEPTALLMDQISSALALAHRSGVVHRDLKPANILLDEDGNAYLSDFGIAKDFFNAAGEQTGTDMILGSPDYLSPEQARSELVSPQTDIYSLGVMLYEILTGEHPFPNKTPVERMYQHLNDPLPRITTLNDEIADGVNDIIQKATAKNPANRYADVLEVAADFRHETVLDVMHAGESLVEQLTLREQEVLQLLIDGCSNQEIAEQLVITPGTVKWYLSQLYRKLRVRSRVQAIVRARELSLIVPAESNETADTEATYVMLPEPENPYKGLRAFQAADARDFFGREKLVEKLVTRLAENNGLSRFLAVVGPSGSGKSSVVKAGLIPALWRGSLPGSDRWFVVEVVPGPRPLDELEVALTRVIANSGANLREHLERDRYGLLRVAGLILPDDGSELVIVFDQFEELFTLVEDETVRTHCLDLIHAAVTDQRSRVRVIVTLRADFYDRPLHYPEFGELMRSRMETVLPLSAEEFEAAITKPAERVGLSFESGLVAHIVSDVHYQPGALPLLQYALTELFEQREDRTLKQAAYHMLGGAVGALAKRADDVYCEQAESGRDAIRQMFLRLVALDEDATETRRRVFRSELLSVAADEDVMDEVIDTYAAYRLLTLDRDPATRKPTVELAHEAILREWQRLREWLDESRHDIRQQRLLAAATAEWQHAHQEPSYLLRGAKLEQFEGWAAETQLALTQDERDYLNTSIAEFERQESAERARQQRELDTQRQLAEQRQRAANRLRYLVAGLAIFLLAALLLSVFAFRQRNEARDARDNAEREAEVNHSLVLANEAVKEFENGDDALGLLLALEAVNMDQPPTESLSTLSNLAFNIGTRAVLQERGNQINTVAFNPDTTIALSGSCADLVEDRCLKGEITLWDVETSTELRRFNAHSDWVNSAVFSPDGTAILSGSSDSTLLLRDVQTGNILQRFEGHKGPVNSVIFLPGSQTIISGGNDMTLIVWDVQTGKILRRFEGHTDAITTLALSPDGQILASGSADGTIILWNLATGEPVHQLKEHTTRVDDLAFRPGSNSILSVGDIRILEWNIETGELERSADIVTRIASIDITPDGRTAIITPGVGTRLWDIVQWRTAGHVAPGWVYNATGTLSTDGRLALTGREDGFLYLVNTPVSPEVRRFEADVPMMSVDVSPDGRYLLTGAFNGGVAILWDAETGQEIRRFEGQSDVVGVVGFSPDGRTAVLGSADFWGSTTDRKLVLVDIESGQEIHQLEGHKFGPRSLAFSPDGRYLLTGSLQYGSAYDEIGGGDLILWEAESGTLVRRFEMTDSVMGIAFSEDGQTAYTGSTMGIKAPHFAVWDVTNGQLIRRFDLASGTAMLSPERPNVLAGLTLIEPETGTIIRRYTILRGISQGVDISSDGRYLVGGDLFGLIVIWDFQTAKEVRSFAGHSGTVWNLVFNPDGQTFYTSSYSGEVIEWRFAKWPKDELIEWINANRYTRDFTCEERVQYRIEPLCE